MTVRFFSDDSVQDGIMDDSVPIQDLNPGARRKSEEIPGIKIGHHHSRCTYSQPIDGPGSRNLPPPPKKKHSIGLRHMEWSSASKYSGPDTVLQETLACFHCVERDSHNPRATAAQVGDICEIFSYSLKISNQLSGTPGCIMVSRLFLAI